MKFRACEELLFEQAICSTSHLRKINEQSNCLWDTTTQYSHLLGQFCDSLRLLKMMIFMNLFGGLRKLNSIQNDVFWCPGVTGTLPKWFWINLGWLTFYHFSSKICPQKIVFEYREHQFYANSGGFEARILKFMIFSSAVFKGFKF